jgi:hypothetical protein
MFLAEEEWDKVEFEVSSEEAHKHKRLDHAETKRTGEHFAEWTKEEVGAVCNNLMRRKNGYDVYDCLWAAL